MDERRTVNGERRAADGGGISLREWARTHGVALSTASKAASSGRLRRRPDGTLAADAEFASRTRAKVDGASGKGRAAQRVLEQYRTARAKREVLRARREALLLKREEEGSMPLPEAERLAFAMAAATKDALRMYSVRLVGPLTMRPADAVRATLREEVERTLNDLRRLVEAHLARHRPQGQGKKGGADGKR